MGDPIVEARTYPFYRNIVGTIQYHPVRPEETLYDIAREYDLGIIELMAANPGIDPWLPPHDVVLVIPSAHIVSDVIHSGIVINLPEMRLYYFTGNREVMTFPIGIGTEGFDTPEGNTRVMLKRKNPVWVPPDSIRAERPELPSAIPPGSGNPLGDYALNLAWPRVVIHGTNRPWSIGTRSSHGCIRMYPEDIGQLFAMIKKGTPVTVINQSIKVAAVAGKVYVEAHPSLLQASQLYNYQPMQPEMPKGWEEQILSAVSIVTMDINSINIDWEKAKQAILERRGQPVLISN